MKTETEPTKVYPIGQYDAWRKDPAIKHKLSLWRNPGVKLIVFLALTTGLLVWTFWGRIWSALMGV